MQLNDMPFESGVLLQKSVEVRHEFVDSFPHVHVADFRPHNICVRKDSSLVFITTDWRLDCISRVAYRCLQVESGKRTHVYLAPSSIFNKSFAIAWYVNSCTNGVRVSMDRSVMISVARGRGGSDDL